MWVFLDGHKYTPTGTPQKMTHHAGEVYVTLSNRKVGVYHFFGQVDYTERLIDLSSYFTNDPYYICNGPNCVYVFEKETTSVDYEEHFIKSFVKISTTTFEVEEHVTLSQTAHCYPTYARFKLWFTTPAETTIGSTDRQSLFYYDTLTEEWSSDVEIPGNKQFVPHKIHWGKQGFMWVDGYNENSLFQFSDSTGAYIDQIIFNRKPLHMYTDSSRNLLVSSYDGMVSTIDQTGSPLSYSNDYATAEETSSFMSDGTHIWCISDTLERTSLATSGSPATHDVVKMEGQTGSPPEYKDYAIVEFSDTSFNEIYVVPLYTHNEWNTSTETIGEVTETQHIVTLTDNSLYVATNFTDSWTLEEVRNYYITARGTAMIATGPEKYYGETT